jgi:hypothetical protein
MRTSYQSLKHTSASLAFTHRLPGEGGMGDEFKGLGGSEHCCNRGENDVMLHESSSS